MTAERTPGTPMLREQFTDDEWAAVPEAFRDAIEGRGTLDAKWPAASEGVSLPPVVPMSESTRSEMTRADALGILREIASSHYEAAVGSEDVHRAIACLAGDPTRAEKAARRMRIRRIGLVVADVIEEVARQDEMDDPSALGPLLAGENGNSYEGNVLRAAYALREALRLIGP